MNTTRKPARSFQIRSFLDWCFAVVSFLIFLALQGALLYAYFVFVNQL